jgi:mono/diheme cytochrome c family protein
MMMSPKKLACGLLVFALAGFLTGSAAEAQNLDQGKSAPKLFSESCVTCHRSPRGLAKGRFRLTLYMFLQKHYVSGSGSAWALASYLESVDSAKRDQARGAKRPASTTGAGRSSFRPPAPVPAR